LKTILSDTHFEILGVSKQCSKEEIKKAYRKQSMLWHPDKFSNDKAKWEVAHLKFIKIAEAYELLKNYEPPKIRETQKPANTNFKSQTTNKTTTTKTDRTNIIRTRVQSSNVFAIGYDKNTMILQVEFKNGILYEYYEVPETIYFAFMNASSKGRFVGNLYKYKYRQV
jgi:hypothetical protein